MLAGGTRMANGEKLSVHLKTSYKRRCWLSNVEEAKSAGLVQAQAGPCIPLAASHTHRDKLSFALSGREQTVTFWSGVGPQVFCHLDLPLCLVQCSKPVLCL